MATDQHLLTDLRLAEIHASLRPVYEVAVRRRRLPGGGLTDDFQTIGGKENLGQAVIIRLLTPRGELTELGHPEYGSRLHELIGTPNTETQHTLARLYILESLQREPRIEKVTEAIVTPDAKRRHLLHVTLGVLPVGLTETVTIGPFTLTFQP